MKKAFCNNHLIQDYIVVFWYLGICAICKLRIESDHYTTQNDKTFTEKKKQSNMKIIRKFTWWKILNLIFYTAMK